MASFRFLSELKRVRAQPMCQPVGTDPQETTTVDGEFQPVADAVKQDKIAKSLSNNAIFFIRQIGSAIWTLVVAWLTGTKAGLWLLTIARIG